MKLGCSSSSYDAAFRAGRMDLRDFLERCAGELDMDGVEIADAHFASADPEYLRGIKKRCTDLQLTIAGLAVTNNFGERAPRAIEIAKVQQWCDIAAILGAPIVRIFAGSSPPQPQPTEAGRIAGLFRKVFGEPPDRERRVWSDVAFALRECADRARERGVVLALQNSARAGLVGAPQLIERCVRDVGSEWLRVCLDPAGLPYRTDIEPLLPRTVQVHARIRAVGDDGSDLTLHWPELLRLMRLGGYRGFVLMDYEGPEAAETAVPRGARYLRGAMLALARRELLGTPATSNGHESNGAVAIEATALT